MQRWHVIICRAYDRAAVRFRGNDATINFSEIDYSRDRFMQVTAIAEACRWDAVGCAAAYYANTRLLLATARLQHRSCTQSSMIAHAGVCC